MSTSPVTYDTYFQHGMPDEEAAEQHWTGERYSKDLAALGVGEPAVTDRHVALVHFPYMQVSRHLHIDDHGVEVGNVQPNEPLQERLAGTRYENWDIAAAVMRISGDFHDIGYKNVDADTHGRNAWPPQLVELIDGMADWRVTVVNGERHFETFLTEKGKNDELTRMVAHLFELPEDGAISHKGQGSNEFDSALAAVQFLKCHGVDGQAQPLDKTDLVAVAAIIAATIPFRANAHLDESGNLVEGFMEQLGRRVHTELLRIGHDPRTAYRTTNAIMAMGVCVANRDTSPFTWPDNMGVLTQGGRQLRAEEVVIDGQHIFRSRATTMSGLTRAARLTSSAPGLYQLIMGGVIPAENLPTAVVPFDDDGQLRGLEYSYPPQEICAEAAGYAKENVSAARDLFLIHEVGIAAGRVLLRKTGELDTEVPGGVNAKVWLKTMQPTGEHFNELQAQGGQALAIYKELSGTAHRPGLDLVPERAPLSMMVLGGAGLAGTLELSDMIERHWQQAGTEPDPYFDNARTEELNAALLKKVGPHNYNTTIDILAMAALFYNETDRLKALDRLKVTEPLRSPGNR